MTIAVYGRPVNATQIAFAENVLNILASSGCSVIIHKQYYEFLKSELKALPHFLFLKTK